MSRAAWLNALLAAAVAALGAWVYFKPSQDAAANRPLSVLKPAEARAVRIERGGTAPIVLEKQQDAWRLSAPYPARANDFAVRQLLDFLEARPAGQLAATNLERFELAPPALRVTVDGQAFGFGLVSPVTREQYVLAGDAVFVVSPRYGAQIPSGATELVSKQLFGPGETPVRFELERFTIEQRDGKWAQVPAAPDLSQDDFARWVEAWRGASALRVDLQGAGKALATIRLQLKDGATVALALLAREPELVLARIDEKLQYTFHQDVARRLLVPPSEPAGKK